MKFLCKTKNYYEDHFVSKSYICDHGIYFIDSSRGGVFYLKKDIEKLWLIENDKVTEIDEESVHHEYN